MPFLDHLEELRWRILWSLLALVIGTVIGFYLVQRYDVLGLLKRPIAGLLPDGKLFVTRPADAFIITLKLAVVVGGVLAAPVVAWQAWKFLSPALYEREKRFVVPTLTAGFVLFVAGGLMAYLWVLPAALRILFSFQREDLEFIITASEYFNFASLFILAFGIVFELPLVIVLLAAFGLVNPATFARQRPIALVIGAVVAALLTPPDVFSMTMMLVPMIVLYEGGILVARLVWRSQRKAIGAAGVLVALLAMGRVASARAQQPPVQQPPRQQPSTVLRPPPDSLARDSLGRRLPMDSAAARAVGLPSAPKRSFPPPDSVLQALMRREGFRITRYAGDSLSLEAQSRRIDLTGSALVEREGSTLEADTVRFFQADCRLEARGTPTLFDRNTVLVGEGMGYNTCEHRGIVEEAHTSFNQSGVEWFLRGALAVDSASTRLYAGSSRITSDTSRVPHWHFSAGQIKWVTNTILVARPAVLYVRDVPVLWLPFIFQDMRQGRRSGLLVPRFGINDLVRPNRGYKRHVNNVGYYVALNDYMDMQASLDWWSETSVQVHGQLDYRWLNRFVSGSLAVSRLFENGGARSLTLTANHQQSFDQRTSLNARINYASSARVLERNSVDPLLTTASLQSNANFQKQFAWGTLALGGSRSQDLSNGVVTQTLPTLNLTPRAINLSRSVTWSPAVTVNSTQRLNERGGVMDLPPLDGRPRVDTLFVDTRATDIAIRTPLRIGSWNWENGFTISDDRTNRRTVLRVVDPTNPADTLTRFYGEDFSTGVDWTTGIGLPILFQSTWRLAPRVGIQNSAGGDFLIRNRNTGGRFVSQSKRLSFGASVAPTLFGFFPGFGPLSRIRHAVSPGVSWEYAPSATVPEDYAKAIDPTGTRGLRTAPPRHALTFSLQQTFEAKFRLPRGDTATDDRNARKIKLLSIQTSGVSYDFEQAKQPGKTGWTTAQITNAFTSDLLPGFSISTSHDLWVGAVGSDTARFDPFLSSISTRFSVSAATFARILAWIVGGPAPVQEPAREMPQQPLPQEQGGLQPQPQQSTVPGALVGYRSTEDLAGRVPRGRGLELSVGYEDQRTRAGGTTAPGGIGPGGGGNRSLSLSTGFSPTRNWSLSWSTMYNFTTSEFGQHMLRLERDLHRWRATFAFVKAPNGNFAFNFHITLLDQPDIKFQYDQRTVR
ncbi:MAG TPA: twin-arginine translocase subunit TatC [Gemmatimonadales bacterium]|nr:twin-arginine translocase subunit TatC [Gemmatimonadales bacterium]